MTLTAYDKWTLERYCKSKITLYKSFIQYYKNSGMSTADNPNRAEEQINTYKRKIAVYAIVLKDISEEQTSKI